MVAADISRRFIKNLSEKKKKEKKNIKKQKGNSNRTNNGPAHKIKKKTPSSIWIAATRVRNYVLNDPCLDWLDMHGKVVLSKTKNKQLANLLKNVSINKISQNDNNNNISIVIKKKQPLSDKLDDFTPFIMKKGLEFENGIVNILKKKFGKHMITIKSSGSYSSGSMLNAVHYQQTLDAMKKGVPVIYQGMVINEKNMTYGYPDLIVRSDYINDLVSDDVMDADDMDISSIKTKFNKHNKKGKDTNGNGYHYRIVDIKHSCLHMRADGVHLLNSNSFPAYKAQLYIYNQALGNIQGYVPPSAYILGRCWKYTSKGVTYYGSDCFDKLGTIDFSDIDAAYVDKSEAAISWIRDVVTKGNNWTMNPPTRKELYPNMCNKNDGQWKDVKEFIAEEIKEITILWYCGIKQREIAHGQGIYTFDKCTSELLGIGEARSEIIQAIIDVNQDSCKDIIMPKKIQNELFEWHKESRSEFFVDFETIVNAGYDVTTLPECNNLACIFMIGVGHMVDGIWTYKNFTVSQITMEEEYKIFKKFHKYVKSFSKDPKLFHWGNAESMHYQKACERHGKEWGLTNWCNFIKVMEYEPIVVKGAYNFKLKNLAKAMHSHGMIKSKWNYDCKDGLDAMAIAWQCNEESKKTGVSLFNMQPMKGVIKYNEVDCKVVQEIIFCFRTYVEHINAGKDNQSFFSKILNWVPKISW